MLWWIFLKLCLKSQYYECKDLTYLRDSSLLCPVNVIEYIYLWIPWWFCKHRVEYKHIMLGYKNIYQEPCSRRCCIHIFIIFHDKNVLIFSEGLSCLHSIFLLKEATESLRKCEGKYAQIYTPLVQDIREVSAKVLD